MKALVVPKIAAPLQNQLSRKLGELTHLRGLKLAHPLSDCPSFVVDILIGADFYWDFVGDKIIRGPPTAVSSKLGYLLSGPVPGRVHGRRSDSTFLLLDSSDEQQSLQRFWTLETLGITDDPQSVKNELTFENYRDSCITREGDRYSAKLPWKQDHAPLPTNYEVAAKRTRNMIRSLEPDIRDTYNRIINEQEKRGFIERVPIDDVTVGNYIPHHAVKKDSLTTPLRVVYDCSCQADHQSPSLNQCMEAGPHMLNDLVSILLCFRLNRTAISSDIEKAFLHVGLDAADRQYTKFLWLSDPADSESDLITYQFKSVLFGATCSPFILNAVIRTHLDTFDSDTANAIKEDIYVDNVLSSINGDATSYLIEVNDIMEQGGFNLRAISTNEATLRTIAERKGTFHPEMTTNLSA
ncbi:uncharacterized protein [Ptychodera flava]|uniref:uncharacterized protein n=1 Tax=Ptychodera flava TaxID=63121 RepID=UPI00396A6FC0